MTDQTAGMVERANPAKKRRPSGGHLMTEQEKQIADLQQKVETLQISLTALTALVTKKGVITTNEWEDMHHTAYEVLKEGSA